METDKVCAIEITGKFKEDAKERFLVWLLDGGGSNFECDMSENKEAEDVTYEMFTTYNKEQNMWVIHTEEEDE